MNWWRRPNGLTRSACAPSPISRPRNSSGRRRSISICFNVYLHQPQPFKNYLARLQMIADAKPLVLGEFGMDSLREGEPRQARDAGLADRSAPSAPDWPGAVVFSFTDDWYRGGEQVDDWKMGLTTADRKPKPPSTR